MAEIEIKKLMLKIADGAASEPKSLADRIARQLARAALPAISQELGGLEISVTAAQGDDDDSLARQVVEQILRQLDVVS